MQLPVRLSKVHVKHCIVHVCIMYSLHCALMHCHCEGLLDLTPGSTCVGWNLGLLLGSEALVMGTEALVVTPNSADTPLFLLVVGWTSRLRRTPAVRLCSTPSTSSAPLRAPPSPSFATSLSPSLSWCKHSSLASPHSQQLPLVSAGTQARADTSTNE